MKKIKITLAIIFFCGNVMAGFNGITHHSRANCINNETVSWDWTADRWLMVISEHYNRFSGSLVHTIKTDFQVTWRSAAVHFGEAPYNPSNPWAVMGFHFMKDKVGRIVLIAQEYVTNCDIYDGWWDKNK